MQSDKVESTCVFHFLNICDFLHAHYRQRKSLDKQFSYDQWSQSLKGIDHHYLHMIVSGKRKFPEDLTPTFLRYFAFDPHEEAHFLDLVDVERIRSRSRLREIRDRLKARQKFYKDHQEIDQHEKFFSNSLNPLILHLLAHDDFWGTVEQLVLFLKRDVVKIIESLQLLEDLGLITKKAENGIGVWTPTKNFFSIPNQLGSKMMRLFHDECLKNVQKSISRDSSTRDLRGAIIDLSAEQYRLLTERTTAFVRQQLEEFSSNEIGKKQVYQLHLSLTPLTDERDPNLVPTKGEELTGC